jgi:8-oxo-dGTP pyrophosphatase MutT (NUDIX family)
VERRYVVNVEGFVAAGGRFLMVVRAAGVAHAPGHLTVPGGKVDPGAETGFHLTRFHARARHVVAVEPHGPSRLRAMARVVAPATGGANDG